MRGVIGGGDRRSEKNINLQNGNEEFRKKCEHFFPQRKITSLTKTFIVKE